MKWPRLWHRSVVVLAVASTTKSSAIALNIEHAPTSIYLYSVHTTAPTHDIIHLQQFSIDKMMDILRHSAINSLEYCLQLLQLVCHQLHIATIMLLSVHQPNDLPQPPTNTTTPVDNTSKKKIRGQRKLDLDNPWDVAFMLVSIVHHFSCRIFCHFFSHTPI